MRFCENKILSKYLTKTNKKKKKTPKSLIIKIGKWVLKKKKVDGEERSKLNGHLITLKFMNLKIKKENLPNLLLIQE